MGGEKAPRRLDSDAPPMEVLRATGLHPALLDEATLLSQCGLRFQRRSGPGGQHRNKTSSGVFLHHEPTGVTAEATERRSQADNRGVALDRLRMRLAVQLRSPVREQGDPPEVESTIRERYRRHSLRFRETHPDRPGVIALLLDDLHAAGGLPSVVAKAWSVSTTSIVRLMRSHPAAWTLVNDLRGHHGRRPLR